MLLIASYPRSGNTLVRHVIESCYGVKTYTSYREGAIDNRIGADRFIGDAPQPVEFAKTHELWAADEDIPAIYIVRDGRGAIVSYARYLAHDVCPKSADSESMYLDYLTQLVTATEPPWCWGAHVMAWANRSGPTVYVRYEDLLIDPVNIVCDALAPFIDREPDRTKTPPPFAQLHAENPAFYRAADVTEWRRELPVYLEVEFWSRNETAMREFGYTETGALAPMTGGCL